MKLLKAKDAKKLANTVLYSSIKTYFDERIKSGINDGEYYVLITERQLTATPQIMRENEIQDMLYEIKNPGVHTGTTAEKVLQEIVKLGYTITHHYTNYDGNYIIISWENV